MQDLFEVLGLRRTASDREIREAYRRLAKIYHPDSNPDPEAGRRMQAINQAKAVLFDPVKREEHRAKLGLREKLTAQRLSEIRRRDQQFEKSRSSALPIAKYPASKQGVGRIFIFTGVVVLLLVPIAVIVSTMTARPPMPSDPIAAIIARYHQLDNLPMDTLFDFRPTNREMDVMPFAQESLDQLRLHGDTYFSNGEWRMASDYYELYLRTQHDEAIATRLSHCYFKRNRYAEAMELIRDNMKNDSTRVEALYETGTLFIHAEKPFDARDAFAAATQVADKMKRNGRTPPEAAKQAKRELAKLE